MAKVTLNASEANVLSKLAERSKMDCWCNVDGNVIRDRENGNRVMSSRNAVRQLIDGLTGYDVETLAPTEVVTLLNLAVKV